MTTEPSNDRTDETDNEPQLRPSTSESGHHKNNSTTSQQQKASSNEEPDPLEVMQGICRGAKWTLLFCKKHFAGIEAISAVLIVCVTALYAYFAYNQWDTMQRQLRDSEAVQRAQIVIEDLTVKDPDTDHAAISYRLVNVGQTAALNIGANSSEGRGIVVTHEKMAYPPLSAIESGIRDLMNANYEPRGFSVGPGKERSFTFAYGRVSPEILRGDMYSYYLLVVVYWDIFGNERFSSDCIFYNSWAETFSTCPIKRISQ